MILAIFQVIVLQKAVDHGPRKHQNRLSEDWSKFAFAARILLIDVLALSKMSTILPVLKLTPSKSLCRSCAVTAGIVVRRSIFAVLRIAFQFELPDPWLYSPERCAGEAGLNQSTGPQLTGHFIYSRTESLILPNRSLQHPHGDHHCCPTVHDDA